MEIELSLKRSLKEAFEALGLNLEISEFNVDVNKDKTRGDYSSNAALKFSSRLGKKPFEVASYIKENLKNENVDHIDIAGPGFINFFVKNNSLQAIIKKIVNEDMNYGNLPNKNFRVNVEFVSANPTGVLHIGHARGAAYGDSLCRILKKAGYDVTREYYINDAGNQVNNLAKSIYYRYLELLGEKIELTEDMYHGDDIIEIAKEVLNEKGDFYKVNGFDLEFFKQYGMKKEFDRIKDDLSYFRIVFDTFSSEVDIRKGGSIEKEIEFLKPHTYIEDGGTILKTTDYLDDKDRPIVKANGDYTYFLPDIVYHLNKLSRKYDLLIDVLGADHHGYINRMKSALMMHGYNKDVLDIELIQMVRIFSNGEEMKLSKRTGHTITLRELCEETGVDAVRYFMVSRDISSHLDFNIDVAREQSSSNPVYYAQYAHARLCSIIEQGSSYNISYEGKNLNADSETQLLKILMEYPNIIEESARSKDPSRIANYIQKLATSVHGFYTECRVLDPNNVEMSENRLGLAKATSIVLKSALDLIGVTAPQKM